MHIKNNQYLIEEAYKEAMKSNMYDKYGAILVNKKSAIISRGYNKYDLSYLGHDPDKRCCLLCI